MKSSHSKSKHLPYFTGKPENYLLSKNLSRIEKINLYKLKCRMVNVAGNFPQSKASKWCKLCFICPETQEHLINCFVIRQKLKNEIEFQFNYCDIEGPLPLQEKFTQNYTIILTTRERILGESPNGVQI